VEDESLPGAMAVVLRSYAKKLSVVAGQVASARMRDEVAEAVSDYLTLVCAKNLTKVDWIAAALSNGSLPLAFTADVLAQMALDYDNPHKLTTADVGALVVDRMVQHSSEHVAQAVKLLVDASFWEEEGFDPEDQTSVVKKVGEWVKAAEKSEDDEDSLLTVLGLEHAPRTSSSAHNAARVRRGSGEEADLGSFLQGFVSHQTRAKPSATCQSQGKDCPPLDEELAEEEAAFLQDAVRRSALAAASLAVPPPQPPSEEAAQEERDWPTICESAALQSRQQHERAKRMVLMTRTSSGSFRSQEEHDQEEQMAMNSGVRAKPETLRFAQWLANNASDTAHLRHEMAFVYSSQSSGAADSVAHVFSKMVKRFQSFLQIQEKFATPRAVDRLEKFVNHTVDFLNDNLTHALEKLEDGDINEDVILDKMKELMEHVSKIWVKAGPALDGFRRSLPKAISGIKGARKEVSAVAKILDTGFTILGAKAPPVFTVSSTLYRTVWIGYFVIFGLLTIGLLFFALHASGFVGKGQPTPDAMENYQPPSGFTSRLQVCFSGCFSCLSVCDDSQTCFWSFVLLMELLWLLMFVASFALLLVTGVKAFLAAGCAPVYMLGDATVCSQALQLVSGWLEGDSWLGSVSGESPDSLLVCNILSQKFGSGILMAALSNVVAAVLTFQLIVDSAMMHERRRCYKMFYSK